MTLTATGAGNTINYTGTAQAIEPASYVNLILDGGSGVKTMVTGTSVSGTLSIAPTGTATASIGAGLTITVANLTLGGLGRINGTWGSTSSTATNKNDTYFAATTGILSVTNDTRATPTLSVTNSPVTYNASGQSATVAGSVAGTASNILTGGSATQTNAGTYAVTADFTPTDTTSYISLTAASAGNFVINKATPTLSVTNSPVTYNATPQSATVVGSVPGSVTNVKYDSSATVPTNAATYAITADFVPTDAVNYNSLTDASAGNFIVSKANQTITFDALSNKTFGDPDFDVSATASSGLSVSFSSLTTSVCTVSGVSVHLVAVGTCTIRASQAGDSNYNAASNVDRSFSVLVAATKFVIIQPANGTVGTPVTVTVQAQKSDNSVDTNYQSDVTLNADGSATGDGLVDIVNGIGTRDISDTVAETVNLSLTDSQTTGLDVSSTQTLTFVAGAVSQYSLNDPGDMYAKTRLGYTVTRKDSFGNAVGTATSTVYLYSSSVSSTKKFYDDSVVGSIITSIDITPGHSTANFWYYDEEPGTYTVTASDSTPTADGATGIADATDSVVVNPVATKFVILDPTDGTVDSSISVTVQAQKPDNSVDTNYQSDVTLNADGSATGDGLVDIINGVGSLSISDTVAETVNLSLADSQSTGLDVSSTQSVVFVTGAIAQFSLNDLTSLIAGQRAAYTVTRKDQYGNVSSSVATTTVYLYSSSTGSNKAFYNAASAGSVITSMDIGPSQSTADFWYYDELPGNWAITASDNAPSADGNVGINDAVDSLTVAPGSVAAFFIDNPGDMTAGTRLGYTITRKDQFSNLVTSGGTSVYLYTSSSGAETPAFYAASSGGSAITSIVIPDGQSSVAMWYADSNTGTWDVTVSDNASASDGNVGIADATDSVNVAAAPIVATRFVISPPTNGTVDAPIVITVQAEDGNGNVDTTYQSDVTLVTNGSATGGGLVDIVNGVGTRSISDTVAQVVNLSLSDTETTGLTVTSTRNVTFAPGVVAQFAIDNPGDVAAGSRIGYAVTRKDQYGNAVTSGATTVYLYSTSTGVNKKFFDAASGGSAITSIVIPNAQSSIGFWAYDELAGSWFITVSDNATAADGATGVADASDAILVQPAAVAKFLLSDPGGMTVSTRLGYVVTRKDQFDNLVTTGVTLAYLYSSSTGVNTAFYTTAVGGASTAFATINDGNSSGDFWYYDETPGTWLVTASDSASAPNGATGVLDAVDSVAVSSVPIVATRFVILQPSTVQVGTPATITIEAQDNSGNVDTTIQSSVTLVASGSATGAGLVTMVNGVGTKTLQDTVAEVVNLSLSDTQSTGLDVSSTRSLTFSATPVAPASGGAGVANVVVPVITGVRLSGRAFPGAKVQILAVSPQGTNVQGQTTASANGSFTALLTGIEEGAGAYGLIATDNLGRTTQTKVFNANVANRNALLTLDAILLSPTLGLVHPTVRKNDVVGFVGSAVPGYALAVQVDGKTVSTRSVAASDGSYKVLFPTGTLDAGSHTVRLQQVSPAGLRSDFTPQKVFTVTTLFTPQTDFNQDGVINVQDWSIFLTRWSSPNKAVQLLDDLNGDGKVDVSDLSIFVRTIKK
ncbi:MAG: MBG domain-containing protein [Minisyncoccia bacterium]